MAIHWISHNLPGRSSEGWEPYPLSLRLQNLLVLFFGRWSQQILADTAFSNLLWASVWRQQKHLEGRLETHLLGNHLLENAITLTMFDACFEPPRDEPARSRSRRLDLLRDQLAEQILPDGMHYERSPMYQVRLIYGLTLLANTGMSNSSKPSLILYTGCCERWK